MIKSLFSLLSPRLGIGLLAAAALLGGWLWLQALRSDNAALRLERDALAERLADREARLAARARAIAALEAALTRSRDAARHFNAMKKETRHAPDGEDGPMAPVLARALERLRAPRAAIAAD